MAEKKTGKSVMEIIKAIHQAAADAYDGGEEVGLNREEGNPILDSRVMDGFGVRINGNVLRVSYHGQVNLKTLAGQERSQIVNECENMLSDIVTYLKKQYRKQLKSSLNLKEIMKEAEVFIESTGFNRTWVKVHKDYQIENISLDEAKVSWEETLRESIKQNKTAKLEELGVWLPPEE